MATGFKTKLAAIGLVCWVALSGVFIFFFKASLEEIIFGTLGDIARKRFGQMTAEQVASVISIALPIIAALLIVVLAVLGTYWVTRPRQGRASSISANPYADSLRDTASGLVEAISGRVKVHKARFDAGRVQDIVASMATQLVNSPELMSADKTSLTTTQRKLLTEYQFRQREVETWIQEASATGYPPVKIAKSMLHRLQNQERAIIDLIEKWDD